MNLSILLLIPALTAVAILVGGQQERGRLIALFGAVAQVAAVAVLLVQFTAARAGGDSAAYIFQQDYMLPFVINGKGIKPIYNIGWYFNNSVFWV